MSGPCLAVLIVEDDASIQRLIKRIIAPFCLSTEVAGDGAVAIELLQSQRFDLVFLDIMLPKKNGFDVADMINRMETRPAVIVISAVSRYFQERFPAGTVVLQKPLDFAQLEEAVRSCAAAVQGHGRAPEATAPELA